ncbi:MAG: response regulator [bacterium]
MATRVFVFDNDDSLRFAFKKYLEAVFDDEDSIRTMLTKFLEKRGYEIMTFSYPTPCQTCRCQGGNACTDIVMTDIDMLGFTGLEFIENQKRIGCKAQSVAIMSGNWSVSQLWLAQKLGCDVFHKPLITTELNEWLDACEKNMNPNRALASWYLDGADGQD